MTNGQELRLAMTNGEELKLAMANGQELRLAMTNCKELMLAMNNGQSERTIYLATTLMKATFTTPLFSYI
jgi:hypothetical protein